MKFYCKEIRKGLSKEWFAILFSDEEICFHPDALQLVNANLTIKVDEDFKMSSIVRPSKGSLFCEYIEDELTVSPSAYVPEWSHKPNTVYVIKTTQGVDKDWGRPNIFENRAFSSLEEAEDKVSEILECDLLDILNATITAINIM